MSKSQKSDSESTSLATDEPGDDDVIISARDVSKHYGGIRALDGVDLDIHDNEVIALVGDNGAGKSTFIKLLTGVISNTEGSFHIRENGGSGELEEVILDSPLKAQEVGIETVFQELSLSKQHDVAANIFMGREPLEDGLKGRLFRHKNRDLMEQESYDALDEIGFEMDTSAVVEELSGGQQQAVAVARALITDPQVVILDEPTAEVSVEGSRKILDLIWRLKESGKTVIFVSHNMDEVFEVSDRLAILRDGDLVTVLENEDDLDRERVIGLMTGAVSE